MIISLTSDFGLHDGYVGTMKAVMAGIAPDVSFIDITHSIAPQDLRAAAYVLWTALPYFPENSVHLVVVDPGVGTSRRALASRTPWGVMVGPDNGVFSYVWAMARPDLIVAIEASQARRSTISRTFHGRDVFAPAAAHIAAGFPLEELGPVVTQPVRLSLPAMAVSASKITGEVIHIDHFGNAVTSIGRLVWEGPVLHLDPAFGAGETRMVNAARMRVRRLGHAPDCDVGRVRHTYGESAPGDVLALVGSEGMLEIAVNQGHAARRLGLQVGDVVEVVDQAEV